jgi:hypothetical protein
MDDVGQLWVIAFSLLEKGWWLRLGVPFVFWFYKGTKLNLIDSWGQQTLLRTGNTLNHKTLNPMAFWYWPQQPTVVTAWGEAANPSVNLLAHEHQDTQRECCPTPWLWIIISHRYWPTCSCGSVYKSKTQIVRLCISQWPLT